MVFDDREKGFEGKYKRDQELDFKANARRNKLLGLWVAEQLGLQGPEADMYAKSVVVADFEKPGDDDVIEKVLDDLKAKGITLTEADIKRELARLGPIARQQLESGS